MQCVVIFSTDSFVCIGCAPMTATSINQEGAGGPGVIPRVEARGKTCDSENNLSSCVKRKRVMSCMFKGNQSSTDPGIFIVLSI